VPIGAVAGENQTWAVRGDAGDLRRLPSRDASGRVGLEDCAHGRAEVAMLDRNTTGRETRDSPVFAVRRRNFRRLTRCRPIFRGAIFIESAKASVAARSIF
jgi:hypothetical protein